MSALLRRRSFRVSLACAVIGGVAGLLLPAMAHAQTPPDPCSLPNGSPEACKDEDIRTKAANFYRDLQLKGITPKVGTVVSGSGVSVGVELRRDRVLGVPLGAAFETMWSVRGYHSYDLRVGRIRGDRDRAELRPFGTNAMSAIGDGEMLAKGLSYYVEAFQRVYSRMDFYGLGQRADKSARSDFGLVGSTVDVVVQWQRDRHFGASARAGVAGLRLEDGRNPDTPNLASQFTAATAPGLDVQRRYRTLGLAAVVDYRDRAALTSRGSWLGVALWHATPAAAEATAFSRITLDARHFRSVPNEDHVLAFRLLTSTRVGSASSPTPFYLQPTLGGSQALRGFRTDRLRGESLWAASAEYRWHVQRYVELAPFVDVGNVDTRVGVARDAKPSATPGIGVRFRTNESVLARFDYVFGRDGRRLIFTVGGPF